MAVVPESAAIVNALRSGLVPNVGLDHFATGLDALVGAVNEDLDFVAGGKGLSKWIRGEYGTGKTFFSRSLAEGLQIPSPRDVTSPTFVLIQEYAARLPIYHFDAYRLRDDDEFIELGPEEYFESNGVTFVEWADRVERCLPREYLEIRCEESGETERRFTLRGRGAAIDEIIKAIARELP